MIYFTSDLHLGHSNALHFSNRPFADVDEEARVLIGNINNTCSPKDDLYILGDFAYRIPVDQCNTYLKQIKPRIHMLRGNHDKDYDESLLVEYRDYIRLKYEHRIYVLFHYPIESWDRMRYGSYMIHGHIHSEGRSYNERMRAEGRRRYDVGVDANDYMPVCIQTIVNFCGEFHGIKEGKEYE